MQIWKFLLFGVTGDLSKKKILPALAQFAEFNNEKVQVNLVGYSRSEVDLSKIQDVLNQNTSTGKHFINSFNFIQGEYDDSEAFLKIISDLKENERLVTYLAIPPQLFVKILQNSCPYSSHEIDIIIEKPFGRDIQEAQQMIKVIEACDLHQKVHFCDHYLFKTATYISVPEMSNFKLLKNKNLSKITIQALESVDVKNRGGYYEDIGAFKDIFIHLFSLLELGLNIYKPLSQDNYNSFKIKSVELGQYKSYLTDLNITTSKTETYFKVSTQMNINDQNTEVVFESGKKLGLKETKVILEFSDGSEILWQIDPRKQLVYTSDEENITLNLARNNKLDHTNLFESVMNRDSTKFVDATNILTSWEIYNKVIDFKEQNKILPKIYTDDTFPIKYL